MEHTVFEQARRIQRVTLPHPLQALACGETAYVVDASTRGVRLSHADLLPPGSDCKVAFEWEGRPVQFVAHLRWTKAQRGNARGTYQSGFEIASIPFDSASALRGLVRECVERALDEQKANAHGVPPLAPSYVRPESTGLYAKHEWIDGVWRKTRTTDPEQPRSGFTVPSNESRHQVVMLRSAYEVADAPMRDMIRRLAAMSIADAPSVAARRYEP
jgi:hypothetical protein